MNTLPSLNILVVDDHPMYRKGVIKLLSGIPNINTIKEAENGLQALEKCRLSIIDFVFLDINMPIMNGEEVAKIIRKELPQIKIIVITMLDSKRQIVELLKLGVNGFILKSTDENELLKAFNLILDGNQYLTPEVKEKWVEYLLSQNLPPQSNLNLKLTTRELDVIKLICDQKTSNEIADKLSVSTSTINNHKSNIMQKLKTDNMVGVVMYAIRSGIYIV